MKVGIVVGVGLLAGILAILALAIYVEYSIWQECRQDHSRIYCLRLLDKGK